MKQVLQSYRTGELKVVEVPAPGVEPGTVLVRTSVSLVSVGTERMVVNLARKSLLGKARERPDLVRKVLERVARDGVVAAGRAVFDKLDQAIPLGYSCVGRVIGVGEGVSAIALGDRVACAGAKIANHAEVNLVPQNLVVRVPDTVDDECAAFVTVGAIALQGLRIAGPTLGETFAVIGLGLIGQLVVQLLKANGCRVLGIDIDPAKVDLALRLGCDAAIERTGNVRHVSDSLTTGRGVDGVLIAAATSSNDPVELAGDLCRDRGRVVVVGAVGMEVPRRPYYDKEIGFHQSRAYGPGRYDPIYEDLGIDYPLGYVRWTEQRNMEAFLDQCAQHRVRSVDLVSHRFSIGDAEEAYRMIAAPSGVLGVLLTYPKQATVSARYVDVRPTTAPSGNTRVSFIGAGSFATGVLIPSVAALSNVELVAVASARGVSARHAADRFGFQRCSTDDKAIISDSDSDVIFIATRHDLHSSQTAEALRARKHVFVEKPLALDEAGLAEVLDAHRTSGRLLMVGFNRRFAPLVRDLKTFFASRREPLVVHYRVNAGPVALTSWIHDPAQGGGRILGEVCHFVDLICFLCEAHPRVVYAQSASGGAARPDDNVNISLRLSDGSVATIAYVATGDPSAGKERVEVLGSGGWAQLDDFRELRLRRGGKERTVRKLSADKGHRSGVKSFIEAVRSGAPSPLLVDDIAATSRATFAILRSLAGGQPIALPDPPREEISE